MKKFGFVLVLFVALGLISSTFAGDIQSGNFSADAEQAGYALHQGDGLRAFEIDVVFKKSFESRPDVMVMVNRIDASNSANLRYLVETRAVSSEGFLLKISTWADSKVYSIAGSWVAMTK